MKNGTRTWEAAQFLAVQKKSSTRSTEMFWIEMGKLGYRKREPNEPQKEAPSLLRRMISFHTLKLGYSLTEMANLFI